MKRLLCEMPPSAGKPSPLSPEEAGHALQVLRMSAGEQVLAIDGKGSEILAALRIEGKKASLEFVQAMRKSAPPSPELILEAAVLKADAMSWVVEKAAELGANRFVPLESEYVVVKMKDKGPEAFRDRWQRIADQSLKQCERLWAMKVEMPIALESLASSAKKPGNEVRIILDERAVRSSESLLISRLQSLSIPGLTAVRLMVGPEGGWGERDRKIFESLPEPCLRAHLGEAILRAETACLSTLAQAEAVLQRSFLDKNPRSG